MSINQGMFTSSTDLWGTPTELFAKLDQEFGFTTDVCAMDFNAKCEKYFTPEQDGLKQEWQGVCWMNPPYGRVIAKWVQKAYESSLQGALVVCLVPARTDTRWWHDFCMRGEIRFIKGRVRFINPDKGLDNAPFPNAIVIFRPKFATYELDLFREEETA